MKTYIRLLEFLRPQLKLVLLLTLLTVFFVALDTASLWLVGSFIQVLFQAGAGTTEKVLEVTGDASWHATLRSWEEHLISRDTPVETLKRVCLILLSCFVTKNILGYLRRVVSSLIELRMIIHLRLRIYNHIQLLSMKYFDSIKSGYLTALSFNDIAVINNMLRSSFEKIIHTPIQLVTLLSMLFIISWKLASFILLLLPVMAFIVSRIGASIRRKSRRIYAQVGEVLNMLQESVQAIRIIKSFSMEKYEIKRYEKENQTYFRLAFRQRKLAAVTSPLNETLGASIGIFLLWYGGSQVMGQNSMLTPGDFIKFIIILFSTLAPLKTLTGLANTFQAGVAAGDRVYELLDVEPEIKDRPGARELLDFEKSIVLKDVHFSYQENGPTALRDINLEIRHGEVVAFVGHSGAGKTTLVNLIPRLYELSSGTIHIDGTEIRDLQIKSLRNRMGIVNQESILFNDTIRANIGYGVPGAPEAKIIKAAKIANAWEFIEKLDDGLDTIVGERGVKLSGGQKQRISIARAVIHNPPILILDEATSALDVESEKLVQEALVSLMKERTVLVIAHRLATIVNADKIVVFKDGEIHEVGRHKELLARDGYYKRLCDLQFGPSVKDSGAIAVQ